MTKKTQKLKKPTKKKKAKKKEQKKTAKKEKKKTLVLKKTKKTKNIKRKKRAKVITEPVHKTKIRVLGIGGGGGTIVSEIASKVKNADFVVANTDARALNSLKGVKKFLFGAQVTNGLGTGMNPELGELAIKQEKEEKIRKLFEGVDFCVIVSCLGGGVSSGALPTFAKIAKKANCLTFAILTLPFDFEGEKKMENAKEAIRKAKPFLNAFAVVPNERIFQIIEKNSPLKEALSAINQKFAENLKGLIETISLPGLINIDFADLRAILQGFGKLAYLNTLTINSFNSSELNEPENEKLIKTLTETPLYPYTIKGAKNILYNIIGGKNLRLKEVAKISKTIADSLNQKAKIIFGISQRKEQENKITLTLLATGCIAKNDLLKTKEKEIETKTTPQVKKKKITKKTETKKETKTPKPLSQRPLGKKKKTTKKVNKTKKQVPEQKKEKKRVSQKEKILPPKPKQQEKKESPFIDTKIEKNHKRRNGLEVKKALEEEEKEILEKEKFFEIPTIFRQKQK